jgi:hypothetical protein
MANGTAGRPPRGLDFQRQYVTREHQPIRDQLTSRLGFR